MGTPTLAAARGFLSWTTALCLYSCTLLNSTVPDCLKNEGSCCSEVPSSCNDYYACDNGQSRTVPCPVDHHYSPKHLTCLPGPCDAPEPCSSECNLVDGLPNCRNSLQGCCSRTGFSCLNYFSCNQGKLQLEECPPGMVFDHRKLICEESEFTSCGHSVPECVRNCSHIDSLGIPVCDNEKDCCYPMRENCLYFHKCRGEHYALGECGSGFRYNADLLRCDLEGFNSCYLPATDDDMLESQVTLVVVAAEEAPVSPPPTHNHGPKLDWPFYPNDKEDFWYTSTTPEPPVFIEQKVSVKEEEFGGMSQISG